eukprot:2660121-Rhodomonas_salina.1
MLLGHVTSMLLGHVSLMLLGHVPQLLGHVTHGSARRDSGVCSSLMLLGHVTSAPRSRHICSSGKLLGHVPHGSGGRGSARSRHAYAARSRPVTSQVSSYGDSRLWRAWLCWRQLACAASRSFFICARHVLRKLLGHVPYLPRSRLKWAPRSRPGSS